MYENFKRTSKFTLITILQKGIVEKQLRIVEKKNIFMSRNWYKKSCVNSHNIEKNRLALIFIII